MWSSTLKASQPQCLYCFFIHVFFLALWVLIHMLFLLNLSQRSNVVNIYFEDFFPSFTILWKFSALHLQASWFNFHQLLLCWMRLSIEFFIHLPSFSVMIFLVFFSFLRLYCFSFSSLNILSISNLNSISEKKTFFEFKIINL